MDFLFLWHLHDSKEQSGQFYSENHCWIHEHLITNIPMDWTITLDILQSGTKSNNDGGTNFCLPLVMYIMQVDSPLSHMKHEFPSRLLAKLCIDENNWVKPNTSSAMSF